MLADLEIVQRRWPRVAAALADAPPLRAELVRDHRNVTLRVEGVHLTSCYDRSAEGELQASRIPETSRVAHVYGIALGDLQAAVLERSEIGSLRVVILSAALARESLLATEHPWLEDPRVDLVLAADERVPQQPFAVAPACLRFADDAAATVRDGLMLELAAPFQARKYREREAMVDRSIAQNQARLRSDGDVASLFGSSSGGRAVVLAGGPTLADSFDWLRRHREELSLIAVSTALLPLQKAGLVPDLAVAVDPKPELVDHFAPLDAALLRSVPLVYAPAVQPAILEAWPGPRLGAYLEQPRYAPLAAELPRGALFCSGTVTHAAADLAVKMQAREVVLLGADFGYVHGRSHVPGAAQEETRPRPAGARTWVLDGHGQRVESDLNLVGYLRDLERYIAGRPEVRFLRGSADGACIAGTHLLEGKP